MSDKKTVAAKVEEAVLPVIEKLGYELIEVKYIKEGPNWYLRLYIDKKGGVTLDDCQKVSEKAEVVIDELNPIPNHYIFEVSSPGLDRPLKTERDFERYEGETVDVRLYTPRDGQKEYQGELVKQIDDKLTIKLKNGEKAEFSMKDVALVKRAIIFNK
ncbi:MAG: ribosome maturation factor RimP [Clostridiales bacterium]|jgi:ribosome maturation factor RimP|nr:ribosome maturation factor RimP [Clostridiales bacterium]